MQTATVLRIAVVTSCYASHTNCDYGVVDASCVTLYESINPNDLDGVSAVADGPLVLHRTSFEQHLIVRVH